MRVRIVEDTEDIAELLRIILTIHGVETFITTSGFHNLLKPYLWQDIDAAIVDLVLNDSTTNGKQILLYIKDKFPNIRRIVFSAISSFTDDLIQLADVHIQKPADVDDILAALGVK